jgi:hypothetical protein
MNKQTRYLMLIFVILLNAALIVASILAHRKDGDKQHLITCVIINITTLLTCLPALPGPVK